jgi:hypothetical protein
MNIYLESVLRLVGLFISVYFTTKWTIKSKPEFDTLSSYLIISIAILLNYIEKYREISFITQLK